MLNDEMEKAALQRLLGDAAPWISSRSTENGIAVSAVSRGVAIRTENGVVVTDVESKGDAPNSTSVLERGVAKKTEYGVRAAMNAANGFDRRSTTPLGGRGGVATPLGGRGGAATPRNRAERRGVAATASGRRSAWEKTDEDVSSRVKPRATCRYATPYHIA